MEMPPAPSRRKRSTEDLAGFGGAPLFPETLHVGRPNLGDRKALLDRIEAVLDARWLTNNGSQVRELEETLASLLRVRNCVAVSNGTVALELVFQALGLRGEVIVPSYTFIATAHAVAMRAMRPVFCDIDAGLHTIDPRAVERLITPRTSAIVGVHLWGRPCQVEALAEIADRHSLALVFDAAHALCCTHGGTPVGGFGTAETFSLHATKFVSAGEGGAITTNDDALAEELRLIRNFGFSGLDAVSRLGTNAKMSELPAALALSSLHEAERLISINQRNHELYRRHLRNVGGLEVLPFDAGEKCNYQYVVVEVDEAAYGLGRDRLMELLHAENVRARRYFWPGCHRMEPYRSDPACSKVPLPATDAVAARVLVLPTGECVTPATVEAISELLAFLSSKAGDVRARAGQA